MININISTLLKTHKEIYSIKNRKPKDKSLTEFNEERNSEFLRKAGINDLPPDKLERLIKYCEEYSKGFKTQTIINVASFGGIFLPLWVSFTNSIFNKCENTSEMFHLFIITSFLATFIYAMYRALNTNCDSIIYSDYYKIKNIIFKLTEEYMTK